MDDRVLKLFSNLSSAADAAASHDDFHIFSHHDADGISAAIILAKTLARAGRGFKLTLLSTLNNDTVRSITECGAKCIIVADMGASYIETLDGIDADVIVLDHHRGDTAAKKIFYTNPHSFGIDGQDGGCGASVAMLFSVAVNSDNWDLVQVAFAGIVGDKQHLKGLTGINEYLFAEGKRRGYIKCADGSLIPPGPLMSSLYRSTEPYMRGVSGNVDGVAALLRDASIDAARSSSDLNDAERRKLSSLIAAKLLMQDVPKEVIEEVCGHKYILKDWNIDAVTFASLLNSCGKSGMGGAGVGLGLGDRKCMADAVAKDAEMQEMIVSVLGEIDKKGLTVMKNIKFFDNDAGGFTGTICEVLMRFAADNDKPTIGCSTFENVTKASARCTHAILRKGVDLSVAMRKAGEHAGGGGGGHNIAAGAWFPHGNEKKFLEALDSIVGQQISAK
ncbi:MAG: DHH family phosphoesterase [Methanomassiliicoccaceae archaeon]|jgi:RecJ-like exonuclease|nr:DHH family phosphoesterase [Methanomassiliicoccaceae archaeon]